MGTLKEQLKTLHPKQDSSKQTSKQKTIENLIQQIENAKMQNNTTLVKLISIVLKRIQDSKAD